MNPQQNPRHAFTIVELLVVIAVIAVLVAIQIPALAASKAGVQRIYCSNNLKQVGVAFRTWAGKNAGRMPMAVPVSLGGAAEAVGLTATATWSGGSNPNAGRGVYWMFMVMSNELTNPIILACPSEGALSSGSFNLVGVPATVFGPNSGSVQGFQNDYNTSYFVGVDATDTNPNLLLAGDHNLGTGANQATKTVSFISAGTNVAWTTTGIGWQDNNHSKQGNVTFADGSVQNLNTAQFRQALNKTGDFSRSAGFFSLASGSFGTGVNRLQFP